MTFLYMNMTSRIWLFRALTLGWMALIFFLSSRSDVPAPDLFWQQDKVFHLFLFGVLGLLLAFSLTPPAISSWRRVLLITALVTVYGVTDELHQYFVPGREASAWDVLADGVGGFLAALTHSPIWSGSRRARRRAGAGPAG
jgi:VanZ family protein